MKVMAKFHEREEFVSYYHWDVEKPEDFANGVANAFEEFQMEYPDVSLFDVSVKFDKLPDA